MIKRIHHVAYRCKDAKQTVEWYGKYLDMRFIPVSYTHLTLPTIYSV